MCGIRGQMTLGLDEFMRVGPLWRDACPTKRDIRAIAFLFVSIRTWHGRPYEETLRAPSPNPFPACTLFLDLLSLEMGEIDSCLFYPNNLSNLNWITVLWSFSHISACWTVFKAILLYPMLWLGTKGFLFWQTNLKTSTMLVILAWLQSVTQWHLLPDLTPITWSIFSTCEEHQLP